MTEELTRDELLRAYAEHVGALTELEQTQGWAVFVDRLRVLAGHHRAAILGGTLDPEQYKWETGWLAGAASALNVPDQVRDQYTTMLAQQEEVEEEAAA